MDKKRNRAALFALLAALLYAVSAPCSKLLLQKISPAMMASLLYLGAGLGLSVTNFVQGRMKKAGGELPLGKSDLPFMVGMVLLDIAAPILLMAGLSMTSAANASLLNNFEIVATSIIALAVFREHISRRLWLAIGLITISSALLSFEGIGSLSFSWGSPLVLAACVCWGFENNCTRRLSGKNPIHIVIIKGIFSGLGALAIALVRGETAADAVSMLAALTLGFLAYGLSILCYILAQRELGAARTAAFYAVSPFIGVLLSFILFRRLPGLAFFAALIIMLPGAYLTATDSARADSRAA
ncbi:MAG TPA: DMT family transporter [Clostridia bacterium]|nr:DMT family transporter [Clostridia bacterium]